MGFDNVSVGVKESEPVVVQSPYKSSFHVDLIFVLFYNIYLKLRKVGGFHGRYAGKYGAMHKGMIHVQDVPNFKYILWHTGNTDEHTAGCLLLGDTQYQNITKRPNGFIGSSVDAYKRVYPAIAEAIERGDDVEVTYIDHDTV